MGSICGRVALDFQRRFGLVFEVCGRKVTCQFTTAKGEPFGIAGRRTTFGFGGSCGSVIPCMGSNSGRPVRTRFSGSFRGACARVRLSKLGPRELVFAPMMVRRRGNHGLYVTRSSIRDCPNVFLVGEGKKATLASTFTTIPGAGGRNKRGRLRVLIARHRGCVTSYRPGTGLP